VACAALALAACLVVAASAVYVDAVNLPSNQFSTAESFLTYPESVIEDAPLLYHRQDDGSGSSTAVDSSGNGLTGAYSPRSAENPAFVMPFDEGTGTTARDLSGAVPARDGTLNGAAWTAGRYNSALSFNGTSDYVGTPGPVVATDASFSVAAWVYLASIGANRTAVSQVGTGSLSGFYLGYRSSEDRFALMMPRSDFVFTTYDLALSTSAPALNTWTHLLGTFDASTGEMRLYVDGVAQGTPTSHPTTWNASGAVEIGSARWSSGRVDYWDGRVDEVWLHNRAVSAAAAAELALGVTSGPSITWGFDENAGTSTQDLSGGANPGTLAAGAGWTTSPTGSAVSLNGTSQYVGGGGPAIRTDRSFTVTAWAYLTGTGTSRTAVSQDGSTISGFRLQYASVNNRWAFTMFTSDSTSAAVRNALSAAAPTLNSWTHLAGVYDDEADQLRIYVNGAPHGTASHATDWNATGPVAAGRGKWNGSISSFFPGGIDGVQLYQRALTDSEVSAVYGGNPVGTISLQVPGALGGSESAATAAAFSSEARNGYHPTRYANPTSFTLECWFRSSGPPPGGNPGTLLSFGSAASGNSVTFDRRVYIDTSGNVVFGSASGLTGALQSTGTSYLDGAWHHLAAVLDPTAGMVLYLDGQPVASGGYVVPGNYAGYWRWGGDTHGAAWPTDYFLGTLDEVAVYGTALPAQSIAAHYHSRNG
jgi:hypothetical protein